MSERGLQLDDLSRRLVDLADSAGPWDDPLPEIRRRAAELTTSAADAGDSSVFRSPTAGRRPRGWLRSIDPTLVAAAAAVVALVAGVGWLFHTGGPSSEKASSGSVAHASRAATDGGVAGATTAGPARAIPGATGPSAAAASASSASSASPAVGCAWPAPTGAVTLRAPTQATSGAVVSVAVRLSGRAATSVWSPLVVAMRGGQVVGRLVPTVIPPGPRLRPSSPTAMSTTLTGTLRLSSCAQAIASLGSNVPRSSGTVLPPGRYQLLAVSTVSTASGSRLVSAPVTVTVIR